VHTHAPHATAIAMTRRDIPPCHYMITRFGGGTVRCAPYALFGTAELSAAALAALEGRTACLLANHGFIATGATLDAAMAAAVELEALAKQYILACSLGGPVLLEDQEIEAALEQFATAYKPNA
jgi:L-fuculose-phosphate aldolase